MAVAVGQLKQRLGGLGPTERKDVGQALNAAMAAIERAAEQRVGQLAAVERRHRLEAERLDLTELLDRPEPRPPAPRHPDP